MLAAYLPDRYSDYTPHPSITHGSVLFSFPRATRAHSTRPAMREQYKKNTDDFLVLPPLASSLMALRVVAAGEHVGIQRLAFAGRAGMALTGSSAGMGVVTGGMPLAGVAGGIAGL